MPPRTSARSEGGRPRRFGPFYRKQSPTQTPDDAANQEKSGEIWGRGPAAGLAPQVQAYVGPLPRGIAGIEFYTDLPPDPGGPPRRVSWSGEPRRRDVRTAGGFAIIDCVITANTQVTPR